MIYAVRISLFLALCLGLSACDTDSSTPPPDRDLKSLEITDIELTAGKSDLNEGLVPEQHGNSVSVVVKVKNSDGTISVITNPIMSQFAFTAKHLKVSTYSDHTLSLYTDANSFDYRNENFELGVSVTGNSFPEKKFTFGIRWAGLTTLNYSWGSTYSPSNLIVYTAHVKDEKGDYRAYHISDLTHGSTTLAVVPASQKLKIVNDGASGSNGAAGANGSSYSCDVNGHGGTGENGQNGMNGEDGGNAGTVLVNYISPTALNYLSISTIGGSGGSGGAGGKGGSGCSGWGSDGQSGFNGSDGHSTQPVFHKVSVEETMSLFADGHDLTAVQFVD